MPYKLQVTKLLVGVANQEVMLGSNIVPGRAAPSISADNSAWYVPSTLPFLARPADISRKQAQGIKFE